MTYFNGTENDDMRGLLMQWLADKNVPTAIKMKLSFYGLINILSYPPIITELGLALLKGDIP